jgi:hypothetical protein
MKHSLRLIDWTTGGGEPAQCVEVGEVKVGDIVLFQGRWEAWTNWPYGPKTDHDSRIQAIKHLRTIAKR